MRRWNTIFLPSGDHEGVKSPIVLSVSCTCPVPSEFMTQISKSGPPLLQEKTMRFPSGDHDGALSSSALLARENDLLCLGRPVRIVVDRRRVVCDVLRPRPVLDEVVYVHGEDIAIRRRSAR